MDKPDDMKLLQEYAASGSEAAFSQIASRYVNLVYSAALRQVTNPELAQEVTQAVFIILAQKAGKLKPGTVLVGWLFQTTRYAASDAIKRETRRQRREQEAYQMESLSQNETENQSQWQEISPMLDEALANLSSKDRDAILLRFFENKDLSEVGSNLGVSEEAAKKRVARAVEKLRSVFVKRGVAFSVVGLAGLISANAVQAAPVGVASSISLTTTGTFVAASTSTIANGTIKVMAWAKLKTALVIGTAAVLVAGTTAVTVEKLQEVGRRPWQVAEVSFDVFAAAEPEVSIVPTLFDKDGIRVLVEDVGVLGIYQPVLKIAENAYGKNHLRTINTARLPNQKYDFIAKLSGPPSQEWRIALRRELQSKLGVVGKLELRETNVLVLRSISGAFEGFKPAGSLGPSRDFVGAGIRHGRGEFEAFNLPISDLARLVEFHFQLPVVDWTGLTGNYDYTLKWDEPEQPKRPNLDGIKKALVEQLGMELVPSREKIEMLILE